MNALSLIEHDPRYGVLPEAPHVTLGRMAAVVVEVAGLRGTVTERDLQLYGFTPEQIAAHGRCAIAMARPDLPADRQHPAGQLMQPDLNRLPGTERHRTMEVTTATAGELRSFAQLIANLEGGQLNADASRMLADLNAALNDFVQEHNGKPSASLTLKLDVKLDGGTFDVKAKLSLKLPDEPRDKTVLWSTPGNVFTVQNPRQLDMLGPREIRTV